MACLDYFKDACMSVIYDLVRDH